MRRRILVIGAGTGASNNLIRSLKAGDPTLFVVGAHAERFVLKKSTADRNYLMAPPGGAAFIRSVRGIVDAERIDLIIPTGDADVDALTSTPVVATLLPGAEFGTRQPFPDARRLLDAGATVALATDCNPGSSFTSSMPFCIALAVREMRMTTEEAVWAATAGGARALRRTDIGHLGVGARADLILLDAPSHAYLAYRPGVPQIAAVWQAGRLVAGSVP